MKHCVITGKLVARTAVHIGSGFGDQTTDALLYRNTKGEWLIPGTALGGVLRTIATRLAPRLGMNACQALRSDQDKKDEACKCEVCHLFGNRQPGEQAEGEDDVEVKASRLWVYNATRLEATGTFIRDAIGIDRSSGTAARTAAAKFDLEVIPAGTEFTFRIELKDADADDEQLLACVLSEWCEGRVWLGGNKARGLGAFDLHVLRYSNYDLDTPDSLMTFLTSDTPWVDAKVDDNWFDKTLTAAQKGVEKSSVCGVARSFVGVTLTLQALGPMVSNDITTAAWTGFDHAPALLLLQKLGKAVLYGSGLRGVLRSQAERIARTLVTQRCETYDDFFAACPACSPVESEANQPLASCDALLKKKGEKSDVEVKDEQLCLACQLFGSTRRGSRLMVEDAPQINSPQYKLLDFLAIDRFTGGGLESAKFDAIVLWKPKFEVRLLLENPQEWELGWLTLVLRDLADGHLSVGFGTSKGFGKVKVADWKAKIGFITPEDFPGDYNLIADLDTQRSGLYHVLEYKSGDTDKLEKAQTVAESWVEAFVDKIDQYERIDQIRLENDSYFNDDVFPLYDKEVMIDG